MAAMPQSSEVSVHLRTISLRFRLLYASKSLICFPACCVLLVAFWCAPKYSNSRASTKAGGVGRGLAVGVNPAGELPRNPFRKRKGGAGKPLRSGPFSSSASVPLSLDSERPNEEATCPWGVSDAVKVDSPVDLVKLSPLMW